MDLLRSCYRSPVRFFRNSGQVDTVRWYFAPPGATWFPDWHSFGSLNYADRSDTYVSIGEQGPSARPWFNGANTQGTTGLKPRGPVKDFQQGGTVG